MQNSDLCLNQSGCYSGRGNLNTHKTVIFSISAIFATFNHVPFTNRYRQTYFVFGYITYQLCAMLLNKKTFDFIDFQFRSTSFVHIIDSHADELLQYITSSSTTFVLLVLYTFILNVYVLPHHSPLHSTHCVLSPCYRLQFHTIYNTCPYALSVFICINESLQQSYCTVYSCTDMWTAVGTVQRRTGTDQHIIHGGIVYKNVLA